MAGKNVFTNDSVADFYNAHFVCYSVDMEKGEGPMLAAMYRIDAYPTLLYLNFNGKMVHRAAGSVPPAEFIATGKTAFDPSQRMEEWKEKYVSGNRDPAFIRDYLKKLSEASMETQEIADWYFATQKNEELLTKENFEMIQLFLHDTESPLFQYFFANRNKYITIVGNEKRWRMKWRHYTTKRLINVIVMMSIPLPKDIPGTSLIHYITRKENL